MMPRKWGSLEAKWTIRIDPSHSARARTWQPTTLLSATFSYYLMRMTKEARGGTRVALGWVLEFSHSLIYPSPFWISTKGAMLCGVFSVFDHITFLNSIFRKFALLNTNIMKNYRYCRYWGLESICLTLDTLLNLSNPDFHAKGK